MSLFVKICGLREQLHVQAAIDAGVDALGFVFADSVRRVSPETAVAICRDVPRHVRRVAVMLHPANDEWLDVLAKFAPDVLQTDSEDIAALQIPDSVERWPVFREGQSLPASDGRYVYEGPKSGRGETVDWSRAAALAPRGEMILAGGLAAANIALAVTTVRPFGIDVSSAVEFAPGQKDAQRIVEFMQAARALGKDL